MRNVGRFALLAGLVLSTGACNTLDDAMVRVFGRSMRDQSSFDPYENTQLPAPGAVSFSSGNFPAARGEVNLGTPNAADYFVPDFTQAQTADPGNALLASLENPVPADEASLARGEEIYNRNCAVCHGVEGIGTGAYVMEKWPALAAYNLAGETVQGYPDGYIYGMIRVGRGMMPSYGHAVTHFDRWNVVNYVRSLQARYNEAQGAPATTNGEN
jgi:mono/diheme cytochrome c family protein